MNMFGLLKLDTVEEYKLISWTTPILLALANPYMCQTR